MVRCHGTGGGCLPGTSETSYLPPPSFHGEENEALLTHERVSVIYLRCPTKGRVCIGFREWTLISSHGKSNCLFRQCWGEEAPESKWISWITYHFLSIYFFQSFPSECMLYGTRSGGICWLGDEWLLPRLNDWSAHSLWEDNWLTQGQTDSFIGPHGLWHFDLRPLTMTALLPQPL